MGFSCGYLHNQNKKMKSTLRTCFLSICAVLSISLGTSNAICEENWYEIPSYGCFHFNLNATMDWVNANAYCQENNGYLAEIENIEMEAMALSLLSHLSEDVPNVYPSVWIGGSDIAKEGVWRWEYSDTEIQTFFWQSEDEPNGGLIENCLELATYKLGWNDKPCDNEINFLCQKPVEN